MHSCVTTWNTEGSTSASTLRTNPACYNEPKGLNSARLPTVSSHVVFFFSVSRMLQNSTFLPPLSQTNRIYPLSKPQSARSTKPFCDSLFPETRLYILPIHIQYQLCSPRLQVIEFSSTRAPLQSFREPPGLFI